MVFPEPPPWADTRPDLADDPIAKTIHAIAVDLGQRGYAPLRELPEHADYLPRQHDLPEQANCLPPQIVARVNETYLLNIRIEKKSNGELACWVKLGPQSWYLDRDDWDGEPIPLDAGSPLDAPTIVLAALATVGLRP
ncbi:hypothetical protein [Streptomyces sp. NBC_01361]|uniref:hypothetical protein n=1 Tax=Streptomyces sp. NBC_01361 TaxID=2903838 RepID=UPI002E31619D|nr:hypothetical protein [Streptomyces sp. NBC_01361]